MCPEKNINTNSKLLAIHSDSLVHTLESAVMAAV